MGLGILPPPGVAPPKAPLVQDFTTSGTWDKPAGARLVLAELIGGGGGGASSTSYGGGNGGDYLSMLFDAASLGVSESVTVGAGGSGAVKGGDTQFADAISRGGAGAQTPALPRSFDGWHPGSGGGWGTAQTSTITVESSDFGAGGGTASTTTGGTGGMLAAALGRLQAGNGGKKQANGVAPGGGGGNGGGAGNTNGAPGAARITTYF